MSSETPRSEPLGSRTQRSHAADGVRSALAAISGVVLIAVIVASCMDERQRREHERAKPSPVVVTPTC